MPAGAAGAAPPVSRWQPPRRRWSRRARMMNRSQARSRNPLSTVRSLTQEGGQLTGIVDRCVPAVDQRVPDAGAVADQAAQRGEQAVDVLGGAAEADARPQRAVTGQPPDRDVRAER